MSHDLCGRNESISGKFRQIFQWKVGIISSTKESHWLLQTWWWYMTTRILERTICKHLLNLSWLKIKLSRLKELAQISFRWSQNWVSFYTDLECLFFVERIVWKMEGLLKVEIKLYKNAFQWLPGSRNPLSETRDLPGKEHGIRQHVTSYFSWTEWLTDDSKNITFPWGCKLYAHHLLAAVYHCSERRIHRSHR